MKYNTQNAKIKSITEKTLIVGIDVGSETHFARAFDWRNYEYSKKPLEFSNNEAGFVTFKAWMEDIAEKNGKDVVIPGMEPTGHYWFNLGAYLQDNGMKPVHVNPHHVKKSKELDDNNPNKNDRKDPKTIAALVNEGRFSYPYIPTGIYAEIRSLSNLRLQTQEEIARIKNRIARWFSIYFPEIKDVYKNPDAISGLMILKVAPLPQDIVKLGVDGINKIWRDAKLRAAGPKRAKTLLTAAEHSIGSQEAPDSARIELKNLLNDYEIYRNREEELIDMLEQKLSEMQVANTIAEIDEKITVIKHALNVANATAKVVVGDIEMSIDTILIRMAQLNKRKNVLDVMRKRLPKAREEQRSYMSRNTVPEYRYINYDLDLIKKEYEVVSKEIMEMQMALDRYNQTVQFEVNM